MGVGWWVLEKTLLVQVDIGGSSVFEESCALRSNTQTSMSLLLGY